MAQTSRSNPAIGGAVPTQYYVLGSGGVYVQSRSAHLVARVLVGPATVRRLAPVLEKLGLTHGPIPSHLLEVGLRWFQETPSTERFFAVRWDGDAYRLVVPEQDETASSLTYKPPAGTVAEFHSHGKGRAFFSGTDDRDEQGFRIYGVVGRVDTPRPELSLRVGGLRPFRPGLLVPGLRRPESRQPAHGRRACINTNNGLNYSKEVTYPCPTTWTTHSCWITPGSPWSAAVAPGDTWRRASAVSLPGGRPP